MKRTLRGAVLIGLLGAAVGAAAAAPEEAFRAANQQARSGDLPRAITTYAELAEAGHRSASLYWNWSQAADARGATGEAIWALLRARELDPGDPATSRELERLRLVAGLEPAELAPEPLAALSRQARRFRLALLSLLLLAGSLVAHALARGDGSWRRLAMIAWSLGVAGVLLAAPAGLAGFASHTAVVAAPDVPLVDAASPSAETLAILREGEVVLVLEDSGGYLRIQDSSGARGWADAAHVRRVESPVT